LHTTDTIFIIFFCERANTNGLLKCSRMVGTNCCSVPADVCDRKRMHYVVLIHLQKIKKTELC